VVDKSLLLGHCMGEHWDTLKVVARTKLVVPIRVFLSIKEHLMKMSAVELLSCESLKLALMHCSNGCDCCYVMVENFFFPLRLNLYLDYVSSRKVLIVSKGFAEHLAEPKLVLA
jgi:hypothetical protein